jgi:hypothetical protein
MSEDKKSWDDIPSLDGLDIEWEFTPENPLGKRKYVRMKEGEISAIFEVKVVSVKVITESFNTVATLADLSEGGIGLHLKRKVVVDQQIKVGFFLGRQKITARAIVKQVQRTKEGYRIGAHFHNINDEYRVFIAGVYASKVLNNR